MNVGSTSPRNPLTSGGLLGGLVRLSGPMLAGAVLQNLQSVIDLFWVGRLGSESVAALALSGVVMMTLFPVVMGMATGTVALVSRLIGAGESEEAGRIAGQSLTAGVLLGMVTAVAGWLWADDVCRLLGADPGVTARAAEYLVVSFAGSFTVFLLFLASSVFQGAGNTLVPMFAMVTANLVNLVLDPVLIYGLLGLPRMEVRGAALATVISQAVAAGMLLTSMALGRPGFHVRRAHLRLDGPLLWRILRIGLPSSGQLLVRSLMSLVLMKIVAGCGTVAVAGYGIGIRFHMIAIMPAFALGNGAATLVGQNLGARKPHRAEGAAWLAVAVGLCLMAVSAAVLTGFSAQLVRVFDRTPAVIDVGGRYLRVVSPFYLFAFLGIILGRGLQGAGDTLPLMIITVLSLWGLQVPLAVYLSRVHTPATDGVWVAINVAMTLHGLLVLGWFLRGSWKHRRV